MVSVVMEGVVVMNSFPPGAVPSTCWPEEELLERGERESARYACNICHLGSWHPQVPSDRQCEQTCNWGGGTSTHRPNYKGASQVLQLIPIILFHKGKIIPDNLIHSIQISMPVFFD